MNVRLLPQPALLVRIMSESNSTVIYKPIPRFPGYRIGDDGSVWSRWEFAYGGDAETRGGSTRWLGRTWHPVTLTKGPLGYLRVTLRNSTKHTFTAVHRTVLLAFVGPCPKGMQCCHGDGNPFNNRLSNLRWDTPKANHADRVKHGNDNRGEKNGNTTLTDKQVHVIRTAYASGKTTQRQLAARFGIAQSSVWRIIRHKVRSIQP